MGQGAPHRTLVVFVKEPRPGQVKTRLVPALGEDDAAGVYRALATAVLASTAPGPHDYERLVFYDPPAAVDAIRSWLPSGRLRRQGPGDLGARITDAFARCFGRGASRVALVGSDTPALGRADVLAAFAALEASDLVLGPAADGGYYLVALRAPQPALFEQVPWSTAGVLEATCGHAARLGLRVTLLRPLRDVDTVADLAAEWPAVAPWMQAELAGRVGRVVDAAVRGGAVP